MHWFEILSYSFIIVVIVLIAKGAIQAFSVYFSGEHHKNSGGK